MPKRLLNLILIFAFLIVPLSAAGAQKPEPQAPLTSPETDALLNQLNEKLDALGPENQTPGDYQTPRVYLNGVEQALTEGCALPEPAKDASLTGNLGPNDFVMEGAVIYCRETSMVMGRVWSPVSAFPDPTDWQVLSGFWSVYKNGVFKDAQSFELTSFPVTDPAPYFDYSFQAPPDGAIYQVQLTGTVRQMPCNNGPEPQTVQWPVTVNQVQVIVQKTGDYIEGATFELWYRNSSKDPWLFYQSRTLAPWDVGTINDVRVGQVDFVLPLTVTTADFDDIKVIERTDQLPWDVWPVDAQGRRIDGVTYARADALHQTLTILYRNHTGKVYLPLINNQKPTQPPPTPTPTPTPTQPPQETCPDYSAEVWIAGNKAAEYAFGEAPQALKPNLNLMYYQAMTIKFQKNGTDTALPGSQAGSQFTRVSTGEVLYRTGKGPYVKIYPSQLPLYEWSKFDAWFYIGQTRCELKFKVWDP